MLVPPAWILSFPLKEKRKKTYIPIHKKRRIKRRKK